jgi:hypothetical protein
MNGTRGSVVGWSNMLQPGRSRVRFPLKLLDFSADLNRTAEVTLGLTQPLTEMSTRNHSEGKGWPARKDDNLTAIGNPII